MSQKRKIIALVTAAGRGTRIGGETPKQYLPLGGTPMIRQALEAFANHPDVAETCAIIHPDDTTLYDAATDGLTLLPPAHGEKRRQGSVRLGLEHIAQHNPTHVLIHDAARPFVSAEVIDRVIAALNQHEAVIPGIPVADTIKQVKNNQVIATLERSALIRVQTPQGFVFNTILSAHQTHGEQEVTDDAALCELAGMAVHVVEGEERNLKITTQSDLYE